MPFNFKMEPTGMLRTTEGRQSIRLDSTTPTIAKLDKMKVKIIYSNLLFRVTGQPSST